MALARLVNEAAIVDHLQDAGEATLMLLEHDATAGGPPARRLAAALAERGWDGDAELAELLLELADDRPSQLRRIRGDLDGVAELLEGPLELGFGGILDCETGDTWPQALLDDWAGDGEPPDPDAAPERYVFIPHEDSRHAWQDMSDLAEQVLDPRVREQLLAAIDGRGAFSRFRRVLADDDDLRARWGAYSAERRLGRAREWLAGEGYAVLPPRRELPTSW